MLSNQWQPIACLITGSFVLIQTACTSLNEGESPTASQFFFYGVERGGGASSPSSSEVATTTMADFCLCSCFLQLTRLVVGCQSQQQFHLINGPHKQFWFPCTSHFHLLIVSGFSFYCLFVYSAQAFCACSVSSSSFMVNFKHRLQAWNMY